VSAPLGRSIVVAAVLAALLVASPVAAVPTHRAVTAGSAVALATDATPVPAGASPQPLPPGELLRLMVTLRSPQPGALSALLAAVDSPQSPEYQHFLTESQFQSAFSPTIADDAAVASYFGSYGATQVSTTADRFGISFELPAAGVAASLGVVPVRIGGPTGSVVFTSTGTASLPTDLTPLVAGIGGLSNAIRGSYSPDLRLVSLPTRVGAPIDRFVDGFGGQPWFFGSDITQASGTSDLFPGSGLPNATFPTREAVATILQSGYNQTTNENLPPYDPVAVQQYFNDTFPASWPQPNVSGVPVNVDGITPPPPGYYNGSNDTTLDEAENSLDLEMAGSLAPGATLVNFYFAGSLLAAPNENPSAGETADEFAQTLAAALVHNYSPANLVAVSASFGLSDLNDTLWNTELQNAAATGVTVLAASGDQGDAPTYLSGRAQGEWPGWPASAAFDTYGDVAVGGFSFGLSGSPNGTYFSNGTLNSSFDPIPGAYQQLSAWYDTSAGPGNYSGTEGGASSVYEEPGWQLDSAAQPTIVNVTVEQGASSLGRAEPDLSFPAYAVVAYVARDSGGVYYALLEGTSIASPVLAGLLATAAAVRGGPFGFLDPELYRIGSFYSANPTVAQDPFLDITNGSNYAFSAGPSWDGTTGWGTLYAPWFLSADANLTIRDYVYTGPTPGLPPPFFSFTSGPPPAYFVEFVGLAGALAVVAVIVVLRPRSGMAVPPGSPAAAPPAAEIGGLPPVAANAWGPAPPAPSYSATPSPPTFLCPYCGSERPAEPVRCPACGRL
jgi:subtilase family serine protease